MAAIETFADFPSTTVAAGASGMFTSGQADTWTVAGTAGFAAASTGVTQFHIADPAANTEIITVSNISSTASGTVWSVVRGADSTTPVSHAAGFTIQQVVSAGVLTSFGQLDTTAGDIAALGSISAGSVGKAADAGHVHPFTSVQVGDYYNQPGSATAATGPRWFATTNTGALTSGDLYVSALSIPVNTVVSSITLFTGTTVKGGGSHGWYVLLDSSLVVRMVTADQTDASTVWGSQKTFYTLAGTASYTTTYSGLYYVGVMVAAGTTPTFAGPAGVISAGVYGAAPVLCGTSGTALTTPPSTGGTMASLSALNSTLFYAYTS